MPCCSSRATDSPSSWRSGTGWPSPSARHDRRGNSRSAWPRLHGYVGSGSDITGETAFTEDGLAGRRHQSLLTPQSMRVDLDVEKGLSLAHRAGRFQTVHGCPDDRSRAGSQSGRCPSIASCFLSVWDRNLSVTPCSRPRCPTTTASRNARPHSPSAAARRDRRVPRPRRASGVPAAWRGIRDRREHENAGRRQHQPDDIGPPRLGAMISMARQQTVMRPMVPRRKSAIGVRSSPDVRGLANELVSRCTGCW